VKSLPAFLWDSISTRKFYSEAAEKTKALPEVSREMTKGGKRRASNEARLHGLPGK